MKGSGYVRDQSNIEINETQEDNSNMISEKILTKTNRRRDVQLMVEAAVQTIGTSCTVSYAASTAA